MIASTLPLRPLPLRALPFRPAALSPVAEAPPAPERLREVRRSLSRWSVLGGGATLLLAGATVAALAVGATGYALYMRGLPTLWTMVGGMTTGVTTGWGAALTGSVTAIRLQDLRREERRLIGQG